LAYLIDGILLVTEEGWGYWVVIDPLRTCKVRRTRLHRGLGASRCACPSKMGRERKKIKREREREREKEREKERETEREGERGGEDRRGSPSVRPDRNTKRHERGSAPPGHHRWRRNRPCPIYYRIPASRESASKNKSRVRGSSQIHGNPKYQRQNPARKHLGIRFLSRGLSVNGNWGFHPPTARPKLALTAPNQPKQGVALSSFYSYFGRWPKPK
jgi:hypothetical protein